ncbi:ABC-three component system protein [Lysinibacillus fusiformis]|uniref:ABC-three component system protein n=1 Tax=Lysinibacillus fusiformis TaxID=28031 RepID=UPI00215AF64C|nr:ABC-three component system protein [Lysinibacillus fusiformis]MCR8852860.1 restriction endonuclease [Lysinibacillus fusiformis]
MELTKIKTPGKPTRGNIGIGTPIPPIKRLKLISNEDFEDIVLEWAYDYLKIKYDSVYRIGGAGDKGRDVVAILAGEDISKFDIYQCKHYGGLLAPSSFWVEFGKLCYYTFKKDYEIPQNYYIVTADGLGPAMLTYLANPSTINDDLIKNWDKYCKKGITAIEDITLDQTLESYIKSFDFKIVKEIQPIRLIDEYSQTKWFKYRFGGGLKKRPKAELPFETVDETEARLPYITQLLKVYSKYQDKEFKNVLELQEDEYIDGHFKRQRFDFHTAQSLKRFSRDEFIDEDPYEEAKSEIYSGVVDITVKKFGNELEKVNSTLEVARSLSLDGNELGKINPSDKVGMCHELVNDNKLKWVK